jgi:hypothetical protein
MNDAFGIHMTKLVIAKLRHKASPVREKRILGPGGVVTTVRKLDAASSRFGDELQSAFAKNVRKARRDNKRIVGSADIAPRKA